MKKGRSLFRMRNRVAVCVFAFVSAVMMTVCDINAVVDTASELPKVKKLDLERPVGMWKAQISRYGRTTLTDYSAVGGKTGRDVNPFAYLPIEGGYSSQQDQRYDEENDYYDPIYGISKTPAKTKPSKPSDDEGTAAVTEAVPEEDGSETDILSEPSDAQEAVFSFTTYGCGNGLGLSKSGADCCARYGGSGYRDILAHYYPGTEIRNTETYEEETFTVGDVSGSPIDILPMVVYSEMSAGAQEEALKAFAVTAYSYIKYRGGTVYDLNTKADPPQNIADAVYEVIGEAIYFDGEIINALFCESGGGATSSYADIFGDDVPYLTSVECEYDEEYDSDYGVETVMTEEEVRDALESGLGVVLSDEPENWIKTEEGGGGYVSAVDVDGQVTVKGVEIMEILGLRSAKFIVDYKMK